MTVDYSISAKMEPVEEQPIATRHRDACIAQIDFRLSGHIGAILIYSMVPTLNSLEEALQRLQQRLAQSGRWLGAHLSYTIGGGS